MTKKQQEFFDYLNELEETGKQYNKDYVATALKEFYKYWKKYNKDGVKDSMGVAIDSTIAFVGKPVSVHLN